MNRFIISRLVKSAAAVFPFLLMVRIACPLVSASAAGDNRLEKHEARLFESFIKGDSRALYDSIESLLLTYPESPESSLYFSDLIRLTNVCGTGRVKNTITALIKTLSSSTCNHGNLYRLALMLEMEKLLYRHEPGSASSYTRELNPLRQWLIAGHYFRYGEGDISYTYEPEIIRNFEGSGHGRRRIMITRADGFFSSEHFIHPRKGVFYLGSSLRPTVPIRLRIYSDTAYVLFVNGREVMKNIRGDVFRNLRVVRVHAGKGISIMIKIDATGPGNLRVLVTGDDDRVLDLRAIPDLRFFGECEVAEILDYPYSEFLKRGKNNAGDGYFRLANYFHERESSEAIRFYRLALSQTGNILHKYLLSQCMIELNPDGNTSAAALEGWRMVNDIALNNPGFIPAAHKRFQALLVQQNYRDAYELGMHIAKKSPRFFRMRSDLLGLLSRLNYEHEFIEEHARATADFPHSMSLKTVAAEYYHTRDLNQCARLCREILMSGFDHRAFQLLLSVHRRRGEYREALELIKSRDANDDYRNERIGLLVLDSRFDDAQNELYENTLVRQNPADYRMLGTISYLQNEDPSMYWGKMIDIVPSRFDIKELLAFLRNKTITTPFDGFRKDGSREIIRKWKDTTDGDLSSRVLYREWIVQLTEDGGSRFFCEELIHVRNQKGVERWGEYKVPLPGTLTPVRVRVYRSDGYSDSYRLEKVNRHHYITISNLGAGSLLHVVYYLDYPFPPASGSGYYTSPYLQIQQYNEPLDYFSLKIIVPTAVRLNFHTSKGLKLNEVRDRHMTVYNGELESLPSVKPERYSGSPLNYLPFIAFSSMRDTRDFIIWYRGLIHGKNDLDDTAVRKEYGTADTDRLITTVYTRVTKDVELMGTVLYYPEKAGDILFRKRGTTEDKTLLAWSLLDRLGIRSFLAFARKTGLPDPGNFVSPEIYTDILLLVPLGPGKPLWMDFSNPDNGIGVVDESLVDGSATVLVGDGFEHVKIEPGPLSGTSEHYNLFLDETGNATITGNAGFYGCQGAFRKHFKDPRYREEMINRYFGTVVPSLSLDDFSFHDIHSVTGPFQIRMKGTGVTVASSFDDILIIQPIIGTSEVSRYILSTERYRPLHINSSIHESFRCSYALPNAFVNSRYVRELCLIRPFGYALIGFYKHPGKRILHVTKEIHVNKISIDPAGYREFLDFCRMIRAAERHDIMIKASVP